MFTVRIIKAHSYRSGLALDFGVRVQDLRKVGRRVVPSGTLAETLIFTKVKEKDIIDEAFRFILTKNSNVAHLRIPLEYAGSGCPLTTTVAVDVASKIVKDTGQTIFKAYDPSDFVPRRPRARSKLSAASREYDSLAKAIKRVNKLARLCRATLYTSKHGKLYAEVTVQKTVRVV